MNSPQAPAAPDPVATANAQTTSNKATAVTNYGLNATDQSTPYGSLSYSQGTPWSDGTPHYTATQTLSPEEQNLFNLYTKTQGNLGQIGVDQSAKVGNILNSPFDLNSAINTQQSDMRHKMLDPVWAARDAQNATKLRDQGIVPGTEAYTNAMRDYGMMRDNSYTGMDLADRGQAATEALTNRNQPLNEISALMSGSQVGMPSFTNTPQNNVANTDVAGITNAGFQNNFANYNAQMNQNNAMYGALGGIAGSALGGWGQFNGFSGLLGKKG